MKSHTSASSDILLRDPPDFSVVLGGPLFQLWRRARLSDDALALLRRRIIVMSLIAWLPLLMFAYQLWQAKLTGGREYGTLAQRYVREFDAKLTYADALHAIADRAAERGMQATSTFRKIN